MKHCTGIDCAGRSVYSDEVGAYLGISEKKKKKKKNGHPIVCPKIWCKGVGVDPVFYGTFSSSIMYRNAIFCLYALLSRRI